MVIFLKHTNTTTMSCLNPKHEEQKSKLFQKNNTQNLPSQEQSKQQMKQHQLTTMYKQI